MILVVQTASEPVIPLPRVLKAAKAGPAPRVNLVGYPSLWLVFRTRHGSQIWCMLTEKITKNAWEPGKNNPIAPLPRSSSLLTLPQGSVATPYHVVT